MGWRGTLLLGALVALAGGYALLDLASDPRRSLWEAAFGPDTAPPAEAVTRLLQFDPATVTAVRIQRGDVTLHVRRGAAGWEGAGRPGAVDELLRELADLAEILVLDTNGQEVAEYGLDPPQAVVELHRAEAEPIVLLIGERNPPATAVYGRVGRLGPVVLTGAVVLWELEKAVQLESAPVRGGGAAAPMGVAGEVNSPAP
jgi:hypothetical protein